MILTVTLRKQPSLVIAVSFACLIACLLVIFPIITGRGFTGEP